MLRQKSFLSLVMSISQQLIGYVSLYFVSRYMGPGPLGIISAALAFSAIFMGFSDFGFGMAHVKKVSEGKDLGKCIGTYALIKIILVTVIGLICAMVIFYLSSSERKLPVPDDYVTVMYIMLGVSMIGGYTRIAQVTFAARIEKAKEWSSMITAKFVTSLLKVITAVTGLGVVFLAWSSIAGAVASALVAFWFLRKLPIKSFDKQLFLDYSKYALPAFVIGISSTFGQELDKVFISMFSNVEEVGYYAGAKGMVQVVTFINVIFVSLLLPTYSRLNAEKDIPGIRKFAQKIERYISFPLVAVGMFIFFFSSPIQIMLLGSEFGESAYIAKILILNAMFLIFAQPYTAQLMGMGKVKLATWISVLRLAFNVLLYLILIPDEISGIPMFGMGARGAAIALLISIFAGTSVFRFIAFKLTGSKPNYIILVHWLVSIIVFASMYQLVKDWAWISNVFVLAGLALAGGLLFILILYIIKQFRKEDLLFYLDTISPGKLGRYVKDEIKNRDQK